MLRSPEFLLRGIQILRLGWEHRETFRYRVARDARVVSHFSYFFWHSSTFFGSENPTPRLFFQFIKQALCKVAQSTLQQPEHTTKQSILNQRHRCHLAYKWYLWLFAASKTIHRGVRGNLIRIR